MNIPIAITSFGENPGLMTMVGATIVAGSLVHVSAKGNRHRNACGTIVFICGIIWILGAIAEMYFNRWAEAHALDVPIRVDLLFIPAILMFFATVSPSPLTPNT